MSKTGSSTVAAPAPRNRERVTEALLDAAERLLISDGYARISTRRLAQEAQVNHGLVHYYFGSMEDLFARVLERFTARLVARQRAMYTADAPFIEKWRTAWRFQEEDFAAGYPKIWFELQAMAWNEPRLRERLMTVNGDWRSVLREAFARATEEYGLQQPPLESLVALVMTLAQGTQLERLLGIDDGHAELLDWIDGWLQGLDENRTR